VRFYPAAGAVSTRERGTNSEGRMGYVEPQRMQWTQREDEKVRTILAVNGQGTATRA
jgi:hypothetical protein